MWWTFAAQAGLGYLQQRKQQDVEEAAFNIRQSEGASKIQAIETQRGRLADEQRDLKAKQRMSVAARGGMKQGTDLLTLAEEAREMQMDQLEMARAADMERVRMENEKAMMDYQKGYTKSWLKKAGKGGLDVILAPADLVTLGARHW